MTNRNLKGLFFKMSGYMPQEVDEMIYRQKAVKWILKRQKENKRQQQKLLNKWKFLFPIYCRENQRDKVKLLGKKKSKLDRLKEQIQNGFDLAKRWAAE